MFSVFICELSIGIGESATGTDRLEGEIQGPSNTRLKVQLRLKEGNSPGKLCKVERAVAHGNPVGFSQRLYQETDRALRSFSKHLKCTRVLFATAPIDRLPRTRSTISIWKDSISQRVFGLSL
jgi:hypothetical protein